MKKTAVFLLSILSSISCYGGGWSGSVEIKEIHQRECSGDRGLEIKLYSPHDNPDSCSDQTTINFSCSHAAFPQIASLAATAMIADKKIWVYLSGCDIEGQAKGLTLKIND
ncbi:hypothetical protein [Alteromonas sp. KUL49]|uniref:hypothetical protein n=1 Tax=Alteromonas sp. KUL49 TaxID=2480798 RepID=UPI00102F03D4|nr:hypothetical protein [Alteromonas sp. KUL49]TAP39711.1 hypothetical protein EYS00_10300 [Alteromonas sp. KUL49]GEA11701.1 hypothetical protein KUL49_20760 [Alteromonas sp. KUL49]